MIRLRQFVAALWSVTRSAVPGDGRELERRVAELVISLQLRSDNVPGGCSILGIGSASGLLHQIDLEAHLIDAVVVGELKAYSGRLPKNDLLRFVGATDDLYIGRVRRARGLPIIRVMAGTFTASDAERAYAAIHGILLVDPPTIPSPILASPSLQLPPGLSPLSNAERDALTSLVHPLQAEFAARERTPRADASAFAFGIRTQQYWSARLVPAAGPSSSGIKAAA